mmetsp:Transcript_44886/g.83176  ORF Transcript_44886/g.83176 Transcript_44886/m.83176 type:complete len:247 (-) Transcript_44886:667-1407(-)
MSIIFQRLPIDIVFKFFSIDIAVFIFNGLAVYVFAGNYFGIRPTSSRLTNYSCGRCLYSFVFFNVMSTISGRLFLCLLSDTLRLLLLESSHIFPFEPCVQLVQEHGVVYAPVRPCAENGTDGIPQLVHCHPPRLPLFVPSEALKNSGRHFLDRIAITEGVSHARLLGVEENVGKKKEASDPRIDTDRGPIIQQSFSQQLRDLLCGSGLIEAKRHQFADGISRRAELFLQKNVEFFHLEFRQLCHPF